MLRKAKLKTITLDRLHKEKTECQIIEVDKIGHLRCWRDKNRECSSECAAWDIYENTNIVRCRGISCHQDQAIATIGDSKVEPDETTGLFKEVIGLVQEYWKEDDIDKMEESMYLLGDFKKINKFLEKKNMEKQFRIVTNEELKLINKYIDEQNFYKRGTLEEVIDMFLIMVGHNIEPEKVILYISGLVSAIKNEYGE